jgi:hypothetical protein
MSINSIPLRAAFRWLKPGECVEIVFPARFLDAAGDAAFHRGWIVERWQFHFRSWRNEGAVRTSSPNYHFELRSAALNWPGSVHHPSLLLLLCSSIKRQPIQRWQSDIPAATVLRKRRRGQLGKYLRRGTFFLNRAELEFRATNAAVGRVSPFRNRWVVTAMSLPRDHQIISSKSDRFAVYRQLRARDLCHMCRRRDRLTSKRRCA